MAGRGRVVRGNAARLSLARALKFARRQDFGKGDNPYELNRPLSSAPFRGGLVKSLNSLLEAGPGKVSVLDKGAGTGRMLVDVKKISPARILATAMSASRTVGKRNAAHFERVVTGSGIGKRFGKKFDVIYDCFGEDYHLPKELVGKSLKSSVANLRKGGVLFTVIPLTHKPTLTSFTVEEGKRFLREFRRKNPGLKVLAKYENKRFVHFEYVDLLVTVRKP